MANLYLVKFDELNLMTIMVDVSSVAATSFIYLNPTSNMISCLQNALIHKSWFQLMNEYISAKPCFLIHRESKTE